MHPGIAKALGDASGAVPVDEALKSKIEEISKAAVRRGLKGFGAWRSWLYLFLAYFIFFWGF